jgi:hypothetical protein
LSYSTTATLTADTVYKFKVQSRNAFGLSTSYSNEVSIRAASVPTAPQTLANNAAVTASGTVGLTWSAPSSNGGSAVIDYQISSKSGNGAFSVLASGISTTSYTASSLTADVVYTFKVTARNLVGLGTDSSEVAIRAAAVPSTPNTPTTSISGSNVVISWGNAPSNGGSALTGYKIYIKQSNNSYSIDSTNCNGMTSATILSDRSCTIPTSTLSASPFSLSSSASVTAYVIAVNVVGDSSASSDGNGATMP